MSDNSKQLSAFPFVVPGTYQHIDPGMTLRDYFAAKAMQALIDSQEYHSWVDIVSNAFIIADLMMEERDK